MTMSSLRPVLSAKDFLTFIQRLSILLTAFSASFCIPSRKFPGIFATFFFKQKRKRDCVQFCHCNLVSPSISAVLLSTSQISEISRLIIHIDHVLVRLSLSIQAPPIALGPY